MNGSGRLAFLPAGGRGRLAHTSELLSSIATRQFLEEAKSSFDYIIVDLPPLGPVVDAKAFAPAADGFVVVVEWGRTPRAVVKSQLRADPMIADKVLGIVLNKVDLKAIGRFAELGGSEKFIPQYSPYYFEAERPRPEPAKV